MTLIWAYLKNISASNLKGINVRPEIRSHYVLLTSHCELISWSHFFWSGGGSFVIVTKVCKLAASLSGTNIHVDVSSFLTSLGSFVSLMDLGSSLAKQLAFSFHQFKFFPSNWLSWFASLWVFVIECVYAFLWIRKSFNTA